MYYTAVVSCLQVETLPGEGAGRRLFSDGKALPSRSSSGLVEMHPNWYTLLPANRYALWCSIDVLHLNNKP